MNNNFIKLEKTLLRKQLRQTRAAITPETRAHAAHAALAVFLQNSRFSGCERIGCYVASMDEFDCGPLMKYFLAHGKTCYLPVTGNKNVRTDDGKDGKRQLQFVRYKTGDPLVANQYGLLEPAEALEICSPRDLDLIFLPLLGFDLAGNRLGTGMGYYDHTLAFVRTEKVRTCRLAGLGYECQCVKAIPTGVFDVRLDGILTEKRWIGFG
jgi:5-formyltetrahydrofolate cyclo-ligase